jgi:hypothetical protein
MNIVSIACFKGFWLFSCDVVLADLRPIKDGCSIVYNIALLYLR